MSSKISILAVVFWNDTLWTIHLQNFMAHFHTYCYYSNLIVDLFWRKSLFIEVNAERSRSWNQINISMSSKLASWEWVSGDGKAPWIWISCYLSNERDIWCRQSFEHILQKSWLTSWLFILPWTSYFKIHEQTGNMLKVYHV